MNNVSLSSMSGIGSPLRPKRNRKSSPRDCNGEELRVLVRRHARELDALGLVGLGAVGERQERVGAADADRIEAPGEHVREIHGAEVVAARALLVLEAERHERRVPTQQNV